MLKVRIWFRVILPATATSRGAPRSGHPGVHIVVNARVHK
ncbi:MAG: hypothetical protein [Podoviridae sp. ctQNx1]|nr:MAG: hypothetical protein [Podoviridae sp. ctQNx1]UOF78119.1 hypothetical protein [Caudoviricetes sp.]